MRQRRWRYAAESVVVCDSDSRRQGQWRYEEVGGGVRQRQQQQQPEVRNGGSEEVLSNRGGESPV